MAYDFTPLKNAISNSYDSARTKAAMENSGLVNDTTSVIGRQLSRAGIKGTLAAAAMREGALKASKIKGSALQDIEQQKQDKLGAVAEQERQAQEAESKANQELLFKVLGGFGNFAKNFIPFGEIGSAAANAVSEIGKTGSGAYGDPANKSPYGQWNINPGYGSK